MNPLAKKALTRPGWVAEKAWLWGRSALRLRRDDVVLAFFPKTGSTWVRIFFFHLLNGSAGDADFSFDGVNLVMPEFANPSFFGRWPFPDLPRLIKTHRPYNPLLARNRVVLFTREPRDTMISFLHYANAKKEFGFSGDLADLVAHPEMGLDAYFRFYQSWLPHAGLVLRYEDLQADPAATFRKLVDFVGIEASDDDIARALEASSLERTRAAQKRSSSAFKGKFSEGFVFARSGQSGEGKQVFDAALEAELAAKRAAHGFTLYPE
jgi:hypothetical protein